MKDANGQPLRVGGAVKLYVRLGDAMYSTAFVIVEHLAVDVILGTTFMNRNVKSIECMRQRIRFRDDRTLPILSSDNVTTPEKDVDARVKEEGANPEPFGPPNNFHTSNTVRLAKGVTIPAMAQLPVRVTTKAAGLVFLDPKMALASEPLTDWSRQGRMYRSPLYLPTLASARYTCRKAPLLR